MNLKRICVYSGSWDIKNMHKTGTFAKQSDVKIPTS